MRRQPAYVSGLRNDASNSICGLLGVQIGMASGEGNTATTVDERE